MVRGRKRVNKDTTPSTTASPSVPDVSLSNPTSTPDSSSHFPLTSLDVLFQKTSKQPLIPTTGLHTVPPTQPDIKPIVQVIDIRRC